jgi:Domain of unknown function (DUF4037)
VCHDAGAVFHDDLDLKKVRLRLAYYPRDVWLYLMLAGWWRVHPEMNLVGRAGYAGDELGSTLIASKIVSGLMHLSFLIERQYAPYVKWLAPLSRNSRSLIACWRRSTARCTHAVGGSARKHWAAATRSSQARLTTSRSHLG